MNCIFAPRTSIWFYGICRNLWVVLIDKNLFLGWVKIRKVVAFYDQAQPTIKDFTKIKMIWTIDAPALFVTIKLIEVGWSLNEWKRTLCIKLQTANQILDSKITFQHKAELYMYIVLHNMYMYVYKICGTYMYVSFIQGCLTSENLSCFVWVGQKLKFCEWLLFTVMVWSLIRPGPVKINSSISWYNGTCFSCRNKLHC